MYRIRENQLRFYALSVKRIFFIMALFLLVVGINTSALAQTDADNKAELVDKVSSYGNSVRGKVYEKLVTLKLSPQCWQKQLSEKSSPDGVQHANNWAVAIVEHAKYLGFGDLNDVGSGAGTNWDKVNDIPARMDGKFSYAIDASAVQCNDERWRLLAAYSGEIRKFVGERYSDYGLAAGWRPRGGKMFVKLVLSATAKDVSVVTDGTNFTVTAPSEVEPSEWDGKISRGLAKGGSK